MSQVRTARFSALQQELALLALLLLLALAPRLYALDRWPPGLYHDEAYNGLDALRVLAGEHPLYFEANNGREPLFIYLVAASIALWGRSPGAIRFVAACLGALTVPATYLLAREMFGRRVGLLAALLAAFTFWPLNLSRVGFRAVALPLLSALALWAFWRGWQRGSRGYFLLAGLFVGLSLYSYLAARFTLVVWALLAGYWLLTRKPGPSRVQWALFGGAAFLVALPLLGYAVGHPEVFMGRASQTAIWNPAISGGQPGLVLLRQTLRAVGMFFWRGDFIPRHNLPDRPVFDLLIAPFFLVGLALCLRQLRQSIAALLLVLWLGVMLLPTILAEGAPHFLRAVGVLPVAFLLPALGLDTVGRYLETRIARPLAWGLIALLLVGSAAWTGYDYFRRHAPSEAAYYNLEAGATELAADINRFLGTGWSGQGLQARATAASPTRRVYLDRRLWEGWSSLRYLVPASGQITLVDPAAPPERGPEREALLLCWPYADYQPALALLPPDSVLHAEEGSKERGDLEKEARLLYLRFTASPATEKEPSPAQRFEQGIVLLDEQHELVTPTRLAVHLTWQATASVGQSYTVFVHVRRGEQLLGQDDAPPAGGRYPTKVWRVGDRVVEERLLSLSAPFDPAQDELWVGLYAWPSLQRLRLVDGNGALGEDHVVVKATP